MFGELREQKNKNVGADKYRDKKYVLHKIAQLIKSNPLSISSALNHSKVFIENPYDKRELAEKVAYNIVNNLQFQRNISLVLGANEAGVLETLKDEDYSNLGGRGDINYAEQASEGGKAIASATASGAQSGGWVGAIVGAVIGTVTAGFGWGAAGKKAKIDEERYRQELIGELFEEPKTNWMPIYIVGGVLIVGGIVTYFALKE